MGGRSQGRAGSRGASTPRTSRRYLGTDEWGGGGDKGNRWGGAKGRANGLCGIGGASIRYPRRGPVARVFGAARQVPGMERSV
jgi:hypothetical protein